MRSIFVAVSGFVGRVESETRCAFWVDEPIEHGFDPSRLITVDLALTPSAAAARRISWDAVQVDDCIARADGNLGGTTLGPRWPELQLVGRVCIEENTWSRLPVALRTPSRPLGGRGYEYLSAVYWPHIDDPRAGRRYAGHYAEILDEKDTIARVAIYRAGASLQDGARPMTTMWLDLAFPGQCDAGSASLTEIGVGKAPKKGALFLAVGSLRADSTAPARLLRLGDTVIDMVDPAVDRQFRELARDGLLARAGVFAIRLIGCETAVARAAQRTMRWLADATGLLVFGTTKLLVSGHFCATGFDPGFEHILAVARPVRSRAVAS